jgi:methionyl-tRNA formyltransferase
MRIVTMSAFVPSYRLLADWAERNGHEIVLVVSLPGGGRRYDADAKPLVVQLPATSSALITKDLLLTAAPVIASLEPDLVISAAFPRLIPPEILAIPKFGALNLHPSALPAGRGPNPFRLVYEGATTIGATLHRTEQDFDTGAILSQREAPLPEDLTAATLNAALFELLGQVLEEGTARALDGEPGIRQDAAQATQAPLFTEAEQVLDPATDTAAVLRRKIAALNLTAVRARVRIEGAEVLVRELDERPSSGPGEPGTVLARHADGWTVRAADRAVRLITR